MTAWFASESGQAVATWLSNGLSLLAIVIGVIVAVVEQRRANAEKAREAARERQALTAAEQGKAARKEQLRLIILKLIDEAILVLQHNRPELGEMYVSWQLDRGKPFHLRSVRSSVKSLRSAAQDDAETILNLNKLSTILAVAIKPAHLDGAPRVEAVLAHLDMQLAAVNEIRGRFVRSS